MACRCSFDAYEHTPWAIDLVVYFSNKRGDGAPYLLDVKDMEGSSMVGQIALYTIMQV